MKIKDWFKKTHTEVELNGLNPEIIATIIKLIGAKSTGTLEAYVAKLLFDKIEERVAERLIEEAEKKKKKRAKKAPVEPTANQPL